MTEELATRCTAWTCSLLGLPCLAHSDDVIAAQLTVISEEGRGWETRRFQRERAWKLLGRRNERHLRKQMGKWS